MSLKNHVISSEAKHIDTFMFQRYRLQSFQTKSFHLFHLIDNRRSTVDAARCIIRSEEWHVRHQNSRKIVLFYTMTEDRK
jgi:hypothetical protein